MTGTSWLSPVRLLDSALLGASFEINSDYSACVPVLTVTVGIEAEHPGQQDNLNLGKCIFAFSGVWHEAGRPENTAFTVGCTMGITIGIPEDAFEEGIAEDRRIRIIDANAVSLVYGKIRSFVEDLTSQSPVGRQTIPAIDPYALLQSLEMQTE